MLLESHQLFDLLLYCPVMDKVYMWHYIDGSIYEQLNKLNERYTCEILVEGVIKRPEWNYDQISLPDS